MPDSSLDGNAAAGVLAEVFLPEMTTAITTCAGCGAVASLGQLETFVQAAGTVLRCVACRKPQLRFVRSEGRTWLDLRGMQKLQIGDSPPNGVSRFTRLVWARRERLKMTATPDDMAKIRRSELSAEQEFAAELIRQPRETGLSLTCPDGLSRQLTKSVLTDNTGDGEIDVLSETLACRPALAGRLDMPYYDFRPDHTHLTHH